MPELRQDPIVDRWVIIAPERALRPYEFNASRRRRLGRPCPFCAGNERLTPQAILLHRNPALAAGDGWSVRVVPNKFPALAPEGPASLEDPALPGDLFRSLEGVGSHEVIVETPRHAIDAADLTEAELADVLAVTRQRLLDLARDPRLAYGLAFKNVGAAAGASLEHAHSQLIATPLVPAAVAEELAGAKRRYEANGRCVWCEMLERERADGRRMVFETGRFAVFAPYASRFPYEICIVPRQHASRFENLEGEALGELAEALKRALGKIEALVVPSAYNYVIHTAPFRQPELAYYHWHLEILPAMGRAAGFEWGSGWSINAIEPEAAAAALRSAVPAKAFPTRETG